MEFEKNYLTREKIERERVPKKEKRKRNAMRERKREGTVFCLILSHGLLNKFRCATISYNLLVGN